MATCFVSPWYGKDARSFKMSKFRKSHNRSNLNENRHANYASSLITRMTPMHTHNSYSQIARPTAYSYDSAPICLTHRQEHNFWQQFVPCCGDRGPFCVCLADALHRVCFQLNGLQAGNWGAGTIPARVLRANTSKMERSLSQSACHAQGRVVHNSLVHIYVTMPQHTRQRILPCWSLPHLQGYTHNTHTCLFSSQVSITYLGCSYKRQLPRVQL